MSHHITRKARIAIMTALIASFFVISPIVLFYTAGYRYDWAKKEIKGTGVVSIDTKPTDASVFLNNIRIKQSLPIKLTNLAPGTFHLSIEKDGFMPWRKDISVISNQTTYIKDVSLYKEDTTDTLDFISEPVDEVVVTQEPDTLLILSHTQDNWLISFADAKTEIKKILFAIERTSKKPTVAVSPTRTQAAIIASDKNDATTLTLINLVKQTISKTVKYKIASPSSYHWSMQEFDGLYVQIGNSIEHVTHNSPTRVAKTLTADAWFISEKNDIWFTNGLTLHHERAGQPDSIYTITRIAREIIEATQSRLIILEDDGIRVFKQQEENFMERAFLPATKLVYNPDNKQWLAWSPWELWTIYENGDVALLRRSGQQISAVRPMDRFGVVLIGNDTTLTAFNPGYFVSHELKHGDKIDNIEVDIKRRRIYFTQEKNSVNRLMSLDY